MRRPDLRKWYFRCVHQMMMLCWEKRKPKSASAFIIQTHFDVCIKVKWKRFAFGFHSIFLPRNGSFAVDVRTISNAISCPILNCGKGKKDRKHLIVKTFRCKYLRKLIFYSDWLLWDRNWIFLNEEYFDCLFVFGNGRTSYNQRCGYWHGIILMKWSE